MYKDNHFTVAGLIKSMFDIVVEYVNLVSSNTCVQKSVGVSFQNSRKAFLSYVWPDVKIFQFGVSFSGIDN